MKYFVISDIHSFYDEFIISLNNAGFNSSDDTHKIILVGDAFDKGMQPVLVYLFIKEMINKNKLIWIVGNHEFLILKRLEERKFNNHNETYKTLYELAKYSSKKDILTDEEIFIECDKLNLRNLLLNNLLPFYEINNFIFAHGFVPIKSKKYYENWRDVPLNKWYTCTMKNGMKCVMVDEIKIPGKTLVCGHTRAAYGNVRKEYNTSKWNDEKFNKLQHHKNNIELFKPYYGTNVIGIDGCCSETRMINCLIIDE